MDCPSCQSKAKEISADRVVCQTCGDITHVAGEWIPTEALPTVEKPTEDSTPGEADPEQAKKGDPPAAKVVTSAEDTDENWLFRVGLNMEGGGS